MDDDVRDVDRSDSGVEDTSSGPEDIEEVLMPLLQEEVDSPSFEMNENVADQQQFDPDLPTLHSYLGQELEVVRGRTVLEDGAIVTLDMLQPADLVLMPGQTLPLTVFDPPTINMLRSCLRNDRTFGVLASWSDGHRTVVNNYGTTVEIYEYKPDEGSAGFLVKGKARQRFRLLDTESNRWKARVRILPEVKLPDPLEGVRLQSLFRQRSSTAMRQRLRKMDAAVTCWPAFVYDQYDVKKLITSIKKQLTTSLMHAQNDKGKGSVKMLIPNDPTELSFWVAQNMPMKVEHKLMLLKLNSSVQRLRWQLKALEQCELVLCCQYCTNVLGSSADIFSMSTEGPQGTYVNPGGYLHETIPLYKVKGVVSQGQSSTEFSWFPGYGWTICHCGNCREHVGWKFKATKSHLKPVKFWGICRRSISVTMRNLQVSNNDSSQNPNQLVEEENPALVF